MKKRIYEIAVLAKGGYARTLRIYSPKNADRAVVMHDGQNVFDDQTAAYKKSWRAADILKQAGIKNTAIVGIDCAPTREDDYTPFANELGEYGVKPSGGKADLYCDYIRSIVIPYLDGRFKYKMYGMLGSSAGALATVAFAALKHPKFKAYGMFSAPLFLSPAAFDGMFTPDVFPADAMYRIYAGGLEALDEIPDSDKRAAIPQMFVDDAFTLCNAVRRCGATDLKLYMDQSAVHDETCWRAPEKEFLTAFSKL